MVEATTDDAVLDGRVRLTQPARGYRAGLDAALLAAACDARCGERVIEPGCGAGAALLAAAARREGVHLLGIERDPAALALAQANIVRNDLQERVVALAGDVAKGFRALNEAPFDAALANPPFFDDPAALRGPAPERQGAWLADDGLAAWLGFLLKAVREGGTITIIHRADRMADILAGLSPRAGSFQVRPLHPLADRPAKRVLIRAVKTGKAPLRVLPGVVLHERQGAKHAPVVEAILRGAEALAWD